LAYIIKGFLDKGKGIVVLLHNVIKGLIVYAELEASSRLLHKEYRCCGW